MARIRIEDIRLPQQPSQEELARITGGGIVIQERSTVDGTETQYVFQNNQSNLTFLKDRANRVGY